MATTDASTSTTNTVPKIENIIDIDVKHDVYSLTAGYGRPIIYWYALFIAN